MKFFTYSLVISSVVLFMCVIDAAVVPANNTKKPVPQPPPKSKPVKPSPSVPANPVILACPGERTCIWYYDNCFSDKDCKAGEVCCNFSGCGNTCLDPKNPTV
ncbi:hypothetical protein EC991_002094 [Linnemannia zychae]|nr:hypothetical protein EC991_002094 [Linnemannia zychae]